MINWKEFHNKGGYYGLNDPEYYNDGIGDDDEDFDEEAYNERLDELSDFRDE